MPILHTADACVRRVEKSCDQITPIPVDSWTFVRNFYNGIIVLKCRWRHPWAVPDQACQMVIFKPKNPNLGKVWRALQWKIFLHVMDIWSILRPMGILYGHLVYFVVIWYIFSLPIWYVFPRKIWQPCSRPARTFSEKLWISPSESH
jgi:hypothetical protein